ncbi:uncharacterized protein LOC142163852 [Nicotiana tabacum]|uniref:Uncharacterized protein LOC142163852 n=1 Tax=Nicotiana tabacum TaxID=4097 RepID=A0AC58RWI5_TOBAC
MVVPWKQGSHIWRKMLECRDEIEHKIVWKPRMGSSLFWFDNWTRLGALYFVTPPDFYCDESVHNVYDVIVYGSWDEKKLLEILPQELAQHVTENIKPPLLHHDLDRPYWSLEHKGSFSVKSAWEYTRRRKDPSVVYKNIWVRGLPFKITFFMWKVWKGKLSFDDYFRRLGYFMSSKCWCYANPYEETMEHVLFNSYAARTV